MLNTFICVARSHAPSASLDQLYASLLGLLYRDLQHREEESGTNSSDQRDSFRPDTEPLYTTLIQVSYNAFLEASTSVVRVWKDKRAFSSH